MQLRNTHAILTFLHFVVWARFLTHEAIYLLHETKDLIQEVKYLIH
jgi:hypothetical protein